MLAELLVTAQVQAWAGQKQCRLEGGLGEVEAWLSLCWLAG
jgi:hypothetical protein